MHSALHVGFPGLPTANHSEARGFAQPSQPYWQCSTEYSSRFSRENWLILANQCSHSIRCTVPLSAFSGPIGFMSLFVLSKTLSVVLPSTFFWHFTIPASSSTAQPQHLLCPCLHHTTLSPKPHLCPLCLFPVSSAPSGCSGHRG